MRVHRLLVVALVAALLPLGASVATAATPSFAGRFIVTLDDGVSARSVAAEYRRAGADVDFVYTEAINGFAGSMSDANVRSLATDRRVARVERDGIATKSATTQTNATWGLDRIDQRDRPVNGTYTYDFDGSGVTAYIVDTGIHFSHNDFGGRASKGYDAFGGTGADCDGHGTHVAGTVGGATYGVAKAVTLEAVRVLDCNGSGAWSGVIAGLDWIVSDHASGVPAVANMSLGGSAISSVDDAVNRAIADGVTVVVSAGNGNKAGVAQNACNYSPARTPAAITVGSTTSTDAKSSWSNYGSCVDLFAPGSSITSAWYTSNSAINTISGTSMASPHVAGVVALYLDEVGATAPATVATTIKDAATQNKVTSSSSAPNNDLLYADVISAPAAPGTLSGTVTGDGTPLTGATVAASGLQASTVDGDYSLELPAGSHLVTVSADGFVTQTRTVTITSSQTTDADFALVTPTPPADVTIDLKVTGTKKKNGTTAISTSWTTTPTGSYSYDVFADGSRRTTTSSTSYGFNLARGVTTVAVQVCLAGTSDCSATVTYTG